MALFELPWAKKARLKEEARRFDKQVELMKKGREIDFEHESKILDLRTTAQKQMYEDEKNQLIDYGRQALEGRPIEDTGVDIELPSGERIQAPPVKRTSAGAQAQAQDLYAQGAFGPTMSSAVNYGRQAGAYPYAQMAGKEMERSTITSAVAQQMADIEKGREVTERGRRGLPEKRAELELAQNRATLLTMENMATREETMKPFVKTMTELQQQAQMWQAEVGASPESEALAMKQIQASRQQLEQMMQESSLKEQAAQQFTEMFQKDPNLLLQVTENPALYTMFTIAMTATVPSDQMMTHFMSKNKYTPPPATEQDAGTGATNLLYNAERNRAALNATNKVHRVLPRAPNF